MNVGRIVGSTSAQSINRKLVHGLIELERARHHGDREQLDFEVLSIGDLPLYDYDLDREFPVPAAAFKAAIVRCDALIIATPEYNRSIPGALKNAIDWASRPYGDNAFAGKPVAIIGASTGAIGTAMAQQHLRNILAYLDAPTLAQPEAYIQFGPARFADDGTVIDESTRRFLTTWLDAFRAWVARCRPAAGSRSA
ncbi:MAG: NADPH-dependent FMN reductase [Acidimicrobiales bacterium]